MSLQGTMAMADTELGRKNLCCISHIFAQSAEQNPTRTAIINLSSSSSSLPRHFTYARLLSAIISVSNRIKRVLQQFNDTERNIRPRIVGVYMSPSVEYIISVFSILRCGDVFLPLDPLWPKERVLYAINSSSVSLVLTNEPNSGNWIADVASLRVLYVDIREILEEKIDDKCDNDIAWHCEKMRKYCYVMYTSGTTGKPKGVCGTEPGILNRYAWMQEKFPLNKDDILLFKTSTSFVDHLQEFLSPLLIGSTLVIPSFNQLKANPALLVNIIKEYNISRLTAVPSLMKIILPFLESSFLNNNIFNPLKILILSGEIFSIQLWQELNQILPKTTILNLYGTTEVSGDCTYFNCEKLPNILKSELLTSVPIGFPINNCNIILSNEGEIQVSGICLFANYIDDPEINNIIFKTGDFARFLGTGDLLFTGRKDRVVKINGQKISLQEIENILMQYPDINNAAVSVIIENDVISHINAYFVVKNNLNNLNNNNEGLERENEIEISFRSWMVKKLVPVMVPRYYFKLKELPVNLSGKIDYEKLSCLKYKAKDDKIETGIIFPSSQLDFIKKVFKEALSIDEISDHDDFFIMGGNSLLAAQIAYKLGIDMRLIYINPTPYKLLEILPNNNNNNNNNNNHQISLTNKSTEIYKKPKLTHKDSFQNSKFQFSTSDSVWIRGFDSSERFWVTRSNKFMHGFQSKKDSNSRFLKVRKWDLRQVWKVNLGSCVDASPLIVCLNGKISLFIGSHSHNFLHINALDGSVRWEVKLEGRVECSAAITSDFSQVVVGCYKGNIYFIDFLTGNIYWKFETRGEVKMQPILDEKRKLIWCGSYDHFLYALNYEKKECFYKISCGGSLYSSPCIDKINEILYVVSTNGLLTALNLESTFEIKWKYEAGATVFGSLVLDSKSGNVICCLVNGDVIALSSKGDIIWKVNVGGPIFAGACLSYVIPYQILVCSRNGSIYSFDMRDGTLIWEYAIGDPITASAFIDQYSVLNSSDRLVCVCSSSGRIHILKIKSDYFKQVINENNKENKVSNENNEENEMVQLFVKMELNGDIFSSPIMIGGRIFVGCRDDYIHCLEVSV